MIELEKAIKSKISPPEAHPLRPFQILSVCSGKGGVGKTMTSVNLSIMLAQAGWRITVLDGDFGMASLKLMLPISPSANLDQWLAGKCKYFDLITDTTFGFKIISAPLMEFQLQILSEKQRNRLARLFNSIQATSNLLLIDNGAGISKNVMGWCRMSNRLLLVTTPDPTAMMCAYATVKAFTADLIPNSIGIIVNQAKNREEGFDTYQLLNEACAKYLGVEADWLGHIGVCRYFRQSIKTRTPPIVRSPKSPFTRSVLETASRVSRWLVDENVPVMEENSYRSIQNALRKLKTMEPVV